MAALRAKKKRAVRRIPFSRVRADWVREQMLAVDIPMGEPRRRLKAWLLSVWDATPRKRFETSAERIRAVDARLEEAKQLGGTLTVRMAERLEPPSQARIPQPSVPLPALPPMEYPPAATPHNVPGELPRRVAVPVNAECVSDNERKVITLALVAEETALDKLMDFHWNEGSRGMADQLDRTAAAVRGDIMRLRHRGSLWAALGSLQRLIDRTLDNPSAELEDHMQRVDRALQAAVTSIVREMRGGADDPNSNFPQ